MISYTLCYRKFYASRDNKFKIKIFDSDNLLFLTLFYYMMSKMKYLYNSISINIKVSCNCDKNSLFLLLYFFMNSFKKLFHMV